MKYGNLLLEKKDFVLIKRYQHLNHFIEDYAHKDALETLEQNMSNALIYKAGDIPEDVIGMYSYVTVRCESGWHETFQLVLPFEDDINNGKISVQSTLGASVIGLSEGDSLKYGLPSDILSLKIENVKQCDKNSKDDTPEDSYKNDPSKQYKNSLNLNI